MAAFLLLLLTVVAASFPAPSKAAEMPPWLEHEPISMIMTPGNLTTPCGRAFANVSASALLHMLDVSGKLPANLWQFPPSVWMMGDYEGCLVLPDVHYCLGDMFQTVDKAPYPFGVIGMCVPRECTEDELQHRVMNAARAIINRLANFTIFNQTFYVNGSWENITAEVHCARESPWDAGSAVALCIVLLCVLLVIVGTVWQLVEHYLDLTVVPLRATKVTSAAAGSPPATLLSAAASALPSSAAASSMAPAPAALGTAMAVNDDGPEDKDMELQPLIARRSSLQGRKLSPKTFVQCFSLMETFPALVSVSRRSTSIHCFDGMRTLSMMWVVLGHCWLRIALQGPDNPAFLLSSMETSWFQAIGNAPYAVDTFFYLSGFLVSYTVLGALARKRPLSWLQYFLHRYFRLTPAYAFVLLLFLYLNPHFGSGPLWYRQQNDNGPCHPERRSVCGCASSWWANLLYVQNLYPFGSQDKQCMSWAWYLANDMQFYWISPLMLWAFHRSERLGGAIWTTVFVATLATTFCISYVYKLSPNALYGLKRTPFDLPADGAGDMNTLIMDKPWARAPCYLLGLVTAFLHRRVGSFLWLKRAATWKIFVGYVMAAALMLVIVFGVSGTRGRLIKTQMTEVESALWITFCRVLFGLVLSWVTLTCLYGKAGVLNWVLAARFWLPFSRLTYCAYLIHPIVLGSVFASLQAPLHYQAGTALTFFVAGLVYSYICALLVALCVEFPFVGLDKMLFSGRA